MAAKRKLGDGGPSAQHHPPPPKKRLISCASAPEEKSSEEKKTTKCAYVTLVMKGNDYVPGAVVLAHSLRQTAHVGYDIVCMVTPDVTARATLKRFFDHVVEVDYLTYKAAPLATAKIRQLYKNWVNQAGTKWQCLSLTQYEKVIFLDSDKAVFENLDPLFQLAAPAATFSSPHAEPFAKKNINNPCQGKVKHGEKIPRDLVESGLFRARSVTLIGTCVLLEPNKEHLETYKNMMKKMEPFGLSNCMNMIDEQSLALLYHEYIRNKRWTYIHPRYNCICWHPDWLEGETPALFHFFGQKPWLQKPNEWRDLAAWWTILIHALKRHPDVIKLDESFDIVLKEGCAWCDARKKPDFKEHDLLSRETLQVTCPVLLSRK